MKAPTKAAQDNAMRADRARGRTVRQLSKTYGLSHSFTHRLVRNIPIILPNRWHLSRMPQEAPLPAITSVHALYRH